MRISKLPTLFLALLACSTAAAQAFDYDDIADGRFRPAQLAGIRPTADGEHYTTIRDGNIFRHRYVMHLTDLKLMDQVVQQLDETEGIAKVRADQDISNGFITVRNIASVISIALIAILLIISVFIISNTIKLTTFDRRDEIAIMKMVGATDGFIRWPFVYEGLLLGLIGAAVAFGLQWLLYAAVSQGIANSDTMQLLRVVDFRQIWGPVAGVVARGGAPGARCGAQTFSP